MKKIVLMLCFISTLGFTQKNNECKILLDIKKSSTAWGTTWKETFLIGQFMSKFKINNELPKLISKADHDKLFGDQGKDMNLYELILEMGKQNEDKFKEVYHRNWKNMMHDIKEFPSFVKYQEKSQKFKNRVNKTNKQLQSC